MNDILYSIGNMRAMEVIDINTGSKLGYIRDLVIDCEEYKILSIVLPSQKVSWFGKNDQFEIPWSRIKKIGLDVILVDASDIVHEVRE